MPFLLLYKNRRKPTWITLTHFDLLVSKWTEDYGVWSIYNQTKGFKVFQFCFSRVFHRLFQWQKQKLFLIISQYLQRKPVNIAKFLKTPILKNICEQLLMQWIYLLKFNNRNTRTRREICLELTIKTPKRRHWRRSGVFIANFEHISHFVLVLLLLTSNM